MKLDTRKVRVDWEDQVHLGWPLGDAVTVFALCDEVDRLRAEVAAYRHAVVTGDGPSCEDVCLVECIGVCGVRS